jgi:hypothetical protein
MNSAAGAIGGDMQDLLAEMENSEFDLQDITSVEDSMSSLGDAQESLAAANDTDDEDERYDRLSDAFDSLNDASSALSTVEHGDAEDIQGGINELIADLDEALGALNPDHEPYLGRSATTQTSKGSKMKRTERIKAMAKSLTADQILELK